MRRRAAEAGDRSVAWRDGVYLLAEDVRSLFNIGSFFRTLDGLGGAHLFLTGISGTPPQGQIVRTALGAHASVPWSYAVSALPVITAARAHGCRVVALESTTRAVPLRQACRPPRALLVMGNEVEGVSPEVLDACDDHVHIPMRGVKSSLNVAVAAGLALWHYTGD
ncbi:MAG: TrmH family RNA methyltransferase [Proteobacteria bacterium]|nr:TrmH family RNA methyltransferase [Pseudomonadota bacterium]